MEITQTGTTEDQEIIPAIKPRKPIAAFFLTLFIPGLGQVYNGNLVKGIIFFILNFLIHILFCRTIGLSSIYLLGILICFYVVFLVYTIIDAIRNAKKQKDYILKRYNTAVHYIVFAIAMVTFGYYFDFTTTTGYQTFIIPSTGNAPTLYVDDRVVADMEAYKNKKPAYGDFAVFTKDDGINYVYRVVGLPGDKIEMEGNLLVINDKKCQSKLIRTFKSGEIPFMMESIAEEWEEILPNGHKHLIPFRHIL